MNENLSLADGSAGIKKKLIEAGALPLKRKSMCVNGVQSPF
ncbi:hypothetical protein HMPREF1611_04030 [Escherichia coli 908573]|nr:hypothetical protein HMPREF1611_04030 [Escherichia coli 908573]